ncbi:MAG: 4-phosphoerythronate dehydrogenase [Psychromonas sp.]|nr:4-phosphoerythronate dehydrogenase [Psychromonas sp.]
MNIYIDENIPYAKAFFLGFGNLHFFCGRSVSANTLKNADILLVRSITKVNEHLLYLNKNLKFVGTATIGSDHIDKHYLSTRGIIFSNAPGCNKLSVAEYVLSALLVVADQNMFDLTKKSVAIVGAGNTGTAVYQRLNALGLECYLYDPPLQTLGEQRDFCSLETVLSADIISLHVPKIMDGKYPTWHLFNKDVLQQLSADQILINTSRGEVIDEQALLFMCKQKKMPTLILDVWEKEPEIDQSLLPFVSIATPHIAGYSLDGKGRGTQMLYQALCLYLDDPSPLKLEQFIPDPVISQLDINSKMDISLLKKLVHLVYDVRTDDFRFRSVVSDINGFDNMRAQYQQRRELSSLTINSKIDQNKLLTALGFSIKKIKDKDENTV